MFGLPAKAGSRTGGHTSRDEDAMLSTYAAKPEEILEHMKGKKNMVQELATKDFGELEVKTLALSNTIVEGMARALFVSTYAEWAEEMCQRGIDPLPPIAKGGEDWMDVAPETPKEAMVYAWRLCGMIEEANHLNIYCLAAAAHKADWPDRDPCDRPSGYDKMFGHYLAMQAMGHGVSWFDDHEKFPLHVPHVSFGPDEVGVQVLPAEE